MINVYYRVVLAVTVSLLSVSVFASEPHILKSPDNRLQLTASLSQDGRPRFSLSHDGIALVSGQLGLVLKKARLDSGFELLSAARVEKDTTYDIPIGKASQGRSHYRELTLSLKETDDPGRQMNIRFRAFNDGLAFRYELPKQEAISPFVLMDELTRLQFTRDPTAHLLPLASYTSSYERYYERQPVSQIRSEELIGLPLLLEHPEDRWLAVTEANLVDYAGMYLAHAKSPGGPLVSRLSPLPGREDGAKVLGETPFVTPWRIIMVAERPGRLIESNIVFHLSEPCRIKDTSWIKPGKTTFPWWNGWAHGEVDFEWGLNTATTKYYIDFCAEHDIPYHSLDGTDKAWYGGPIRSNGPTDITTPIEGLDLQEVIRYAEEKGVRLRLWMHWKALKPQIDEAFAQYEEWGIEGVMVDFMDRDDQEMVNFYYEMARKATKHHLTLTLHGAYKPTGMTRTWPNVLTYEAVLNQEYNKWDPRGTPPRHNINVAFTRMLAGPLDYHQGGMRNVLPADFVPRNDAPLVQGTRGHQLAMYVVYQNHLPMLADFPAAYEDEEGFAFLLDVPCNWDETRVLHAEFGECIVIARRSGDIWYVGGMTADEANEMSLPLDFLKSGTYQYRLWCDDPVAGPTALKITESHVSGGETVTIAIPAAGGFVATLRAE